MGEPVVSAPMPSVAKPKSAKQKPAKRARQNAEAQRNYRRREKEQRDRSVSATQQLQQYINGAEQQMNEVMEIIATDPVIMKRLLSKLSERRVDDPGAMATETASVGGGSDTSSTVAFTDSDGEGTPPSANVGAVQLPPQSLTRSTAADAASDDEEATVERIVADASAEPILHFIATTDRSFAEQHQRLMLNLPGDRYIEGEIESLGALHKEVSKAKIEDNRAGGSRSERWKWLVQVPPLYGRTTSDLLLCFVRWARQPEAVPPQTARGTSAGAAAPQLAGTLEEEPLYNVDRAFRKLCCYVEELNKAPELFGIGQSYGDFASTYSLMGDCFTSRRQAMDGSTLIYCQCKTITKVVAQRGERGVVAGCNGGERNVLPSEDGMRTL
jgi:hypothetical protein